MKRRIKSTQQHILEHWLVDYFIRLQILSNSFQTTFLFHPKKIWIGFKSTCKNENTAWQNSLYNKCKNSKKSIKFQFQIPSFFEKKINAQINIQPVTFLFSQWIKNFFVYTTASLLIIFTFNTQKCKQNHKSCATEEFLEILKNWK